jgi:hypothetical protein
MLVVRGMKNVEAAKGGQVSNAELSASMEIRDG